MGIGSITFSLPHFLTGHHHVKGSMGNASNDNICRAPRLLDQADRDTILKNLPGLQEIKSLTEGKCTTLIYNGGEGLNEDYSRVSKSIPIWKQQKELEHSSKSSRCESRIAVENWT